MPMFYFTCPSCGKDVKVLRSPEAVKSGVRCDCGSDMKRNPRGASSRIVETRDNGVMSRRVEQPADVERLMAERSKVKDPREP